MEDAKAQLLRWIVLPQLRRSLAESVEQQTVTAEILRFISSSPNDTQPVFDTIVRSAVCLCDAMYTFLGRFDGEPIHFAAHHDYTPDGLRTAQQMYPMRPKRKRRSIGKPPPVKFFGSSAVPRFDVQPVFDATIGAWRASRAVRHRGV
jgi:hypothetical protein